MKSTETVWYDDNGNCWDKTRFTAEEAIEASVSSSMYHCLNCINCIECRNCVDCRDCVDCDDCWHTKNCSNCNNCDHITDCITCENCFDCQECAFVHRHMHASGLVGKGMTRNRVLQNKLKGERKYYLKHPEKVRLNVD